MNSTNPLAAKITTEHRAKIAYVYIRQSSPGQVLHHSESTIRQYNLVERAVSLGWPRRKSVRATIGHALEFETWRSLVRRQGLSRTQAVDAMTRLVSSV